MAKGIKIHEHQSLWNLALQHYGSVEGILVFFEDGVFSGFDDVPVVGAKLVPGTPLNKSVTDYYLSKDIAIATARAGLTGGGFGDGFDDGYDIGDGELAGSFNTGFNTGFQII